ncbi:hypothetical protein [Microbispora sp. GKU 823]|uniref:hypothetical protein n=1 Tax=Microbispora sp. GKU 823 TaxID=1652100 RepID=UPI00277B5180|nr:hypothetical protein [Microbispora sp. GKU 823]
MVTGAGLVATPSPGSIFAYIAVTPKGGWFGVIAGIVVATAVSFAVAAALLGFGRANGDQADDPAPDAIANDTTDTHITSGDDRDTTGETAAESVPATKEA